ncbi:MAG TPA: acetate--CoA ligase family protein [Acidimicrobiales bacterium]|nr:acetate--CoA ligase family protein [Acidimicrobiales bacterium]
MTVRDDEHDGRTPDADLTAFYSPRSVVVVGASRQAGKLGHDVLVECARLRFAGAMYGVNPLAEEGDVAGWPLVRSLDDVPGPPDLALVALPARATLDAVTECARVGVRAAVLVASGLGELGGEAALFERDVAAIARASGMRLLGPNGFGLYVRRIGLNLMVWRDIPDGRTALITQSGNVAIALCRLMRRSTVGLASCAGVGNQLDVGVAELVSHQARTEDSDAVAIYLEGLRGTPGAELVDALSDCRAAGKPVVALKGGRSGAGNRSVVTHTAALSGDKTIWDAVLRDGGAHRVADAAEMVAVLEAIRSTRSRRVRAVVVLTDGGGDSVLSCDALEEAGLALASLDVETQSALDGLAPPAAPRVTGQNPVTLDTAGGLEDDPRLLARCAEVAAADHAVDAVVISGTFGGYRARRAEELETVERLAAIHEGGTPVLVHSAFACDDEEPLVGLRRAGIPVFPTVRRLATSLAEATGAPVCAPRDPHPAGSPVPTARTEPLGAAVASTVLPTTDASELLSSVGIRVPRIALAADEAELDVAVATIASPICLKVEDPAVPHKSDVGGVRLDLAPEEVGAAAHELWGRFPGRPLVVMPMLLPGTELLVGLGRDPTFGPYVTVGRGGVTAELDPDVATGLTPMDADGAAALWSSLRCAPLLRGWRRAPGVDLAALCDLVAALSRLGGLSDTLEVECNPVIAYPKGYAIADFRAARARG